MLFIDIMIITCLIQGIGYMSNEENKAAENNTINISGGTISGPATFAAKARDIRATVYQGSSSQPSEHEVALQDLADRIKQSLDALAANNPDAGEETKKIIVQANISESLKQRATSAIKALGRSSLEELLDNAYVNIALAVVDGWKNPA